MLDKIALTLLIIGGLNWGSVGIFQFDLVAWICGGQTGIISRIVYILVGLSAIWCITLLFRDTSDTVTRASAVRSGAIRRAASAWTLRGRCQRISAVWRRSLKHEKVTKFDPSESEPDSDGSIFCYHISTPFCRNMLPHSTRDEKSMRG